MTSEVVERAIYQLGVRGLGELSDAVQQLDRVAVSEERVTRATRTTTDGIDRLIARYNKRAQAEQQLVNRLQAIKRYEDEGTSTLDKRNRATDLVVQKYHEQVAAAEQLAARQQRLTDAAQKYRDELNPLLPLLRAYAAELKEIAELRESGDPSRSLTRDEAKAAASKATETFATQARKVTGQDQADVKAAQEQERLNAATKKYLDMLDPTAAAARRYAAALSDLSELQANGKLSAFGAAAVEAKLTAAYDEEVAKLNGVAEARRKAAESEDLLAADAQKYLDKLNPLLPLERAHNKELERLAELVSKGKLTPEQGVQSVDRSKKEFATASKAATGEDVLDRDAQTIKDRLNPAAVSQRNYAAAVERVNALHKSGKLDSQEYAAAMRLIDTDLKRGTLSTRGMQFALTNLSFQVNDVVTGLISGQQPFRIFAQQAGQFVQVFQQGGGVGKVLGDASRWLVSMITPMNAARAGLAGLAAGFGLVVAKAIELSGRARTFDVALRGFGTSGQASVGDLEKSIKALREYGLTADEAQKSVEKVARTPTVNPRAAASIAKTGGDIGAIRGTGVEGGVDELVAAIKEGPEALIKLGVEFNAIKPKQADHIRDLKEQQGIVAANAEAYRLLSEKIGGSLPASMSNAQKAARSLGSAWSDALESLTKTEIVKDVVTVLDNVARGLERLAKWDFSGHPLVKFLTNIAERLEFIYKIVNKVTSTTPSEGATAARRDMDTALAERDRESGGAGSVPGTARFDASGIKGNTEALQELKVVMEEASRSLPEGYSLVATSGQRNGTGGSLHNTGDAIDIQIKGPSGSLPNKGPIGSDPGMYKDLAVAAWQANQKLFPGKELTWGREFETKKGSGLEDWMHFDRGPHRGRLAPALSTIAGGSTSTSASAADAGRAAPVADSTFQPDSNKADEAAKAYRTLTRDQDALTLSSRKFGIEQQVLQAYTQKYNEALDAGREPGQARNEAEKVATETHKRAVIELQKESQVQEMTTEGTIKATDAFKTSSAEGYRAQAAEDARREAVLKGIDASEKSGFVIYRTRQALEEQASTAVRAAREQTAAAQPQLLAAEKLADATSVGTEAAHQQDIANRAVLRTQDALTKAEAARNPILIAQAKAATDAALADEKRADAAERARRGFEAANENRLTSQQVQFETKIVASGLTPAEQARQLAYFDALQHAAKEFANADAEPNVKAARDAYLDTAKAVADNKYQLTLVQREQERWNNLVTDLANTIENELSRSIENAFSEDKVESWGKRVNRWLGSFSSTLSSSLFVKPALGTLAGALGFGTAASSLGSFGSIGSLLGTGGSSATTTGGSSATITKNEDGTLSLSNISSTASLGKSLGLWDTGSSSGGLFNSSLGGLFNTSVADEAAGDFGGSVGLLNTSLGSFLGGAGAGFGAGVTLNSLLGGNKTTGTVGSGVGSLLGTGVGSVFGSPLLGGITGGLFGSLGGLFGQTHKRANATGVSIDLSTGKASGFTSSGSAENDRTLKEIRDDLSKFTTNLQSSTGGATSGFINPQATDQGIKLDYDIPGFGAGIYETKDSQEAIDNAELAIVKGLTGVSDLTQMVIDKYSGNIDDLKTALDAAADYKDTTVTDTVRTVIDKTTDPSKLSDALKFAETYDKIADAAKDAFASIPSDLEVTGPFEKASDDIKTTFDDIADSAADFGLALQPVTDAREEANKRLTEDSDRYISDLLKAVEDPLQSIVDIEKRAGDQRVKDAKAVAGDIEAVNKLNAKKLNDIWTDATADIKDLRDEFKSGDLSGLTAYQRLPDARTKYVDTLAAVQGGDTSKWDTLIADARSLFSLSKDAYGEGPKTAEWRTAITAVLDNVLAGRSFAGGTMSTPPGMILVGERGPELMAPRAMHLTERAFAAGTEATPPGAILVGENGPELISQPGGFQISTHRETEKILPSGATHQAATTPDKTVVGPPDIKVTHLTSRSFASGTTVAPPEVILAGDRRLEPMSQTKSPQLHSGRDTERAFSTLSPGSGAVSNANSNSSVVSNSSTLVADSSSSVSNQNSAAAFANAQPTQAVTGVAADSLHGAGLVVLHGSEPITLPQDRAVANGTSATPPGTIVGGEKGSELISRPGGLEVHSNREVERIASAPAPAPTPASGSSPGATSGLSVVSNSSAAASQSSSSISVQNIAAALGKQAPAPAFAGGTNATPPGMILVGEKGRELISQPGGLQVYPHQEPERMLAPTVPGAMPAVELSAEGTKAPLLGSGGNRPLPLSSSSADRAVVTERDTSSSAETNRSSLIDRVPVDRAFAGGTKSTPPGMIMVGEKGGELIGMPHDRAFAAGSKATPPGMVLVGERGPELISQPGGLQIYPHRETERIMTMMQAANDDRRAFASGTMATPPGTILVGEMGRELMAVPQGRFFADGTDGRLHDWMVYQGNGVARAQGQPTTAATDDLGEVKELLKKQLAEMKVNSEIARLGHLETGSKVAKQTEELKKPIPHQPTRRKVA